MHIKKRRGPVTETVKNLNYDAISMEEMESGLGRPS